MVNYEIEKLQQKLINIRKEKIELMEELQTTKNEKEKLEKDYKDLVSKYQRISDELILLKAGKPIRRK